VSPTANRLSLQCWLWAILECFPTHLAVGCSSGVGAVWVIELLCNCRPCREDIKAAYAGDIVAIGGLKEVITGETLCDEKAPVILERMDFPDPVIKIAIEPKSKVGGP